MPWKAWKMSIGRKGCYISCAQEKTGCNGVSGESMRNLKTLFLVIHKWWSESWTTGEAWSLYFFRRISQQEIKPGFRLPSPWGVRCGNFPLYINFYLQMHQWILCWNHKDPWSVFTVMCRKCAVCFITFESYFNRYSKVVYGTWSKKVNCPTDNKTENLPSLFFPTTRGLVLGRRKS
jgi:hypothetical protein